MDFTKKGNTKKTPTQNKRGKIKLQEKISKRKRMRDLKNVKIKERGREGKL